MNRKDRKRYRENERESRELKEYDPDALPAHAWRPHMCQFFREAVLRISRKELASKMQVSVQRIGSWENPRKKVAPSRPNLDKLCEVFGCEMFELYTDFDPAHTREFLEDIFRTWSFVLQQAIRENSVSEKRFALHLTQLFMDYDDRRRAWEAETVKDPDSLEVDDQLSQVMFGSDPEDENSLEEPDIEEGEEIDALPPPSTTTES